MAAGGTWKQQNKILPGVYSNIEGEGNNPLLLGDRGICALPVNLPWLPEREMYPLYSRDIPQFVEDFGAAALPIKEAAKNAQVVYAYRLNKGEMAKLTLGNLVCEAKYSGTFGNRISVSIENIIDDVEHFYVITWIDTDEVERQKVKDISELEPSPWLSFKAAAADNSLEINAGEPLVDGSDGTVTNGDYISFFDTAESYSLNAIGVLSEDSAVTDLLIAFAKRMVNEVGKYMQYAGANIIGADFEAIHSVQNGVYLSDGTHVPREMAAAYIVGAMAGVPLTENLTEHKYIGAVDVDKSYTIAQQEKMATTGQMVFILDTEDGTNEVKIQKDINTLTTFIGKKTYAMSKGEVMRIVYEVANMLRKLGKLWIGKMGNSEPNHKLYHGRALLEFRELEKQGVLQDVVPEDIAVKKGHLIDDMEVDYGIKPVGITDKIYNIIKVLG